MSNMVVIQRALPDEPGGRAHYNFDSLKHGDAIEVASTESAREMFRRWKRATGRPGRLVRSRLYPRLLFFVDDTAIV